MTERLLHRRTDEHNWTVDVVDEAGNVLAPHIRCVDGVITQFMFGAWHGPGLCVPSAAQAADLAELHELRSASADRIARLDKLTVEMIEMRTIIAEASAEIDRLRNGG